MEYAATVEARDMRGIGITPTIETRQRLRELTRKPKGTAPQLSKDRFKQQKQRCVNDNKLGKLNGAPAAGVKYVEVV
jgi:hypothetical protein